MSMSKRSMKGLSTERVSTYVLYALVALTVVVFGAFFFIGYDNPYEEDPSFNAPLLTDAVLVFMYLLVAAATVAAVASVVIAFRKRDRSASSVNNIPALRIKAFTFGILGLCLVLTFLLGSSEPVVSNGVKYADAFWLKATDMFINTLLVLLVVAVCGVAFGVSGYSRKIKLKK